MIVRTCKYRKAEQNPEDKGSSQHLRPISRIKIVSNEMLSHSNNRTTQKTAGRLNLHTRHHTEMLTGSQKGTIRRTHRKFISSLSQQSKTFSQVSQSKASNYDIKGLIGKGTFGQIFSAQSLIDGTRVAIKRIYQDNRYQNRQLDILKVLNHQNVIKILSYYYQTEERSKYLNIVMNLYPIDLYTLIKRGGIEPTILKKYLFQILKGLEYLGTLNIAHRDLKPHNILIDPSTNQAVVCDFGSAKRLVEGEENIAYICARCYRAPELVLGATEYTTAIDMWSFGCIVAEILNKKPFFIGDSNIEQFIKILVVLGTPKKEELNEMNSNTQIKSLLSTFEAGNPQIKQFVSTKDLLLLDLLEKILVYSPSRRYTPTQALNHPYFHSLITCFQGHQPMKKGELISKRKINAFGRITENHIDSFNLKRQCEQDKLQRINVPKFNIRNRVI